ncbi:MAG: hypothetical protein WAU33_06855 [Candidatus Binataceae bacterium]
MSLPRFILCIAFFTVLEALGPYFFLEDFVGINFPQFTNIELIRETGLDQRPASPSVDQRHDEQYEKNEKKDPRDLGSYAGNAEESQAPATKEITKKTSV